MPEKIMLLDFDNVEIEFYVHFVLTCEVFLVKYFSNDKTLF